MSFANTVQITDSDNTIFPTMGNLVGEYGIEFTTRKGNFINKAIFFSKSS